MSKKNKRIKNEKNKIRNTPKNKFESLWGNEIREKIYNLISEAYREGVATKHISVKARHDVFCVGYNYATFDPPVN